MIIVERKEKLNIQISLDPFLLFVLISVSIHGLGLLILVLSNRSLSAARQETESTPIEFVFVPPEESPEEPPPETERRAVNNSVAKGKVDPKLPTATDKIGNEEAIATSKSNPTTQPERQEAPSVLTPPLPKVKPTPPIVKAPPSLTKVPKRAIAPSTPTPLPPREKPTPPVVSKPKPAEKVPPVTPPTPPRKIPKRAILTTPLPESIKPTPPVVKKPKPVEKTPLLSESDSTSIPLSKPAPLEEKKPSGEMETATPQTDLPPVATRLPPKPKPIESSSPSTKPPSVPETKPTPSPEQQTPVGSGSASLLGGTYRKTLSEDSGSSFFNPQANASQQARNSSGVDARQDLNLGPYFAEIRRRVKRNWKPSAPYNNRHTVLVFSIQRNGQITGLRIRRSSGSEKIDRESLEAVQKSAPFAALPANFPNEQLDVEFNFNIYVNQGVMSPQLEHWQRF